MLCECCTLHPATDEIPSDDGTSFSLCNNCSNRLTTFSLRPLEFFTLFLSHGPTHYLHDDFYDEDTGEALQPEYDIEEPDAYPFPDLDTLKKDAATLIRYALTKYWINDDMMAAIREIPQADLLQLLDEAVGNNGFYTANAYEIAAKALGPFAEDWVRNVWTAKEADEPYMDVAYAVASCLPVAEGFNLVVRRLEAGSDAYFRENSRSLMFFRSDLTLDWLEKTADRIAPVADFWGVTAAMSQFSWKRAKEWLHKGRPFSLIALDALRLCTTPENKLAGAAFFVRENPPRLPDAPAESEIRAELAAYLAKDAVPRTESAVTAICANIRPMR